MRLKIIFLIFLLFSCTKADFIKSDEIDIMISSSKENWATINDKLVYIIENREVVPIRLKFNINKVRKVTFINRLSDSPRCIKVIASFIFNPDNDIKNLSLRIKLPCYAKRDNENYFMFRIEVEADNKFYFLDKDIPMLDSMSHIGY